MADAERQPLTDRADEYAEGAAGFADPPPEEDADGKGCCGYGGESKSAAQSRARQRRARGDGYDMHRGDTEFTMEPGRFVLARERKSRERTHKYLTDDQAAEQHYKSCGNGFLRKFWAPTDPSYPVHLYDSSILCTGIAPKPYSFLYYFSVSPSFMINLEWSLRSLFGALLATLPVFIDYFLEKTDPETCHNTVYECTGWEDGGQCVKNPIFMNSVCRWSCNSDNCKENVNFTPGENFIPSYDPTFCGIAFVMAMGYTAGESHRFLWEIFAGSIAAALIPQLAINTFGASISSVCGFGAAYVFFLTIMPIDAMTKKFSLGICMQVNTPAPPAVFRLPSKRHG